ncbi:hypothetical protein L1987_74789 [Smallanthus sonchifolius]|uniref:Uncharacterized protein n=1 Tax=Smallanthus sonchifolius TaxID=185202 RepID=A0ACB9A4N8_9ASTR|nr:hypothetical protein L1987_74789 [Smallanthus sonchifolius]
MGLFGYDTINHFGLALFIVSVDTFVHVDCMQNVHPATTGPTDLKLISIPLLYYFRSSLSLPYTAFSISLPNPI